MGNIADQIRKGQAQKAAARDAAREEREARERGGLGKSIPVEMQRLEEAVIAEARKAPPGTNSARATSCLYPHESDYAAKLLREEGFKLRRSLAAKGFAVKHCDIVWNHDFRGSDESPTETIMYFAVEINW